jgi:hypothetical protein
MLWGTAELPVVDLDGRVQPGQPIGVVEQLVSPALRSGSSTTIATPAHSMPSSERSGPRSMSRPS